jgi:hypothetical protein
MSSLIAQDPICSNDTQADTASSAIFLEDTSINHSLVDTSRLESLLRNIGQAFSSRLLQDTEVILSLSADVVREGCSDVGEGCAIG